MRENVKSLACWLVNAAHPVAIGGDMLPLRNLAVSLALSLALAVGAAAMLHAAGATYHGNTESGIFHIQGCKHFNCKRCTAVFESRDAAIAEGYRPCKTCKP
ncbi:hypothetical protein JCM14635_12610 [Megalodesulfovibrio paquesii]|jgi:type IV secretory pathway TrbL component